MNQDSESAESNTDETQDAESNEAESESAETTRRDREDVRKMWARAADFGFIGIEFGIATAIGYFAGRWLDARFDTAPWLAMFLALCGIAAASMDLVRLVRRAREEDEV